MATNEEGEANKGEEANEGETTEEDEGNEIEDEDEERILPKLDSKREGGSVRMTSI